MIIALSIPIYRCDVAFFVETTVEDIKEFYKKNKQQMTLEEYNDIIEDIKDERTVGGAVYTVGVNYICYIRNAKKKGHTDHELWHLTNNILNDRGIEHTRTDEPYAYLNEYLHDEFRDIMRKYYNKKENDTYRKSGSGDTEQHSEGKKA